MEKSSGILLAISSLPNKYGIGSFGEDAKRFVDFLKKSISITDFKGYPIMTPPFDFTTMSGV